MRVISAYIAVVLIWSTTPLAIKWSSSSISFIAAVSSRMLLAFLLCSVILLVIRRPLFQSKKDWQVFLAGALSIYPNMCVVYWSAQFIPSGLVAVIFGLYPFFVGLFSIFILRENIFTTPRVVALLLALFGLLVVQKESMGLGKKAPLGIMGMLLSTAMFALSSVWVKAVGGGVDSFRQLTGSLLVSCPLLVVTWVLMDNNVPGNIDAKSMGGIIYLAIAGSLLGGTLFYYVLRHCTVSLVSLITLITPVIALALGTILNGEEFSGSALLGSAMIILSLALYQGLLKRLRLASLLIRRSNLATLRGKS